MRERKNRYGVKQGRRILCRIVHFIFLCAIFPGLLISSLRYFLGEKHRSVTDEESIMMSAATERSSPYIALRGIVNLPDQVLMLVEYSASLISGDDVDCIYNRSLKKELRLPPIRVDRHANIVRCPLPPIDSFPMTLGLRSESDQAVQQGHEPLKWDNVAYEALIDRDNSTIVFVKGLNLRPDKMYDSSRFQCVFGWNFTTHRLALRTDAVSVAQEIVRCKTPLSVLRKNPNTVRVSVRMRGRKPISSIAIPSRPRYSVGTKFSMCICTMLHNQAKFLREWVTYHASIGVEGFFLYDNNSDDDIEQVIESLSRMAHISRTIWPWVKTQEAGFSHCALQLRGQCEWVGFIDVDEFFHLPSPNMTLLHAIYNQSSAAANVGEFRLPCYIFGPSGLKTAPPQGVAVGYTCRLSLPERHKSIINPEAVHSSLINVVHHFHLRDGFDYVRVDRGLLAINHYKYQVWDVFKDKFYRRVAAYVADWQEDENVGSKDRTPGLGTRAVEPLDWSNRFCEVQDYWLRDVVLHKFLNSSTNRLPWQLDTENKLDRANL